jgi:hypothetical protein
VPAQPPSVRASRQQRAAREIGLDIVLRGYDAPRSLR